MSGPLVQAIGWALLHLLWQGAIVAAILAAALALLRRQSANARYLVSCGALLIVVALGVATAYRYYTPPAVDEPAVTATPDAAPTPAFTFAPSDAPAAATFSFLAFITAHLGQIVAVWLIGVLILSTRLIAGWIGARRLARRNTRVASEQWQRSLWRIASSLRLWRAVDLFESGAVEVPTVVGWLRPVVLLPIASLSGLSTQQIEMVLAHELAHIRRHDFIVNLMQSIVETLLFYHPAVWWISQQIRVEREHCCDDLAVSVFGDPLQYARALTRFEELRITAAQTALAANGGSLLGRIRRLVVARAESANWSSRWAAGLALITIMAMLYAAPALPLFASYDDQPKKQQPAPEKKKDADKADKEKPAKTEVEVNADSEKDKEMDAESDDSESGDDQETPAPPATPMPDVVITPPHVAVHVAPMAPFAPFAAVVGGVEGGIRGGIEGGVRTRRRHIGEGGKLTVDDLIELRSAGVTSKYIDEMRGILPDTTLDDLVELRSSGVTSNYIKAMSEAGYSNLNARDLVEMRSMGVDPNYVRALAEAGYSSLTVKQLISLKASGVDAAFIRDLAKYRSK
ncbi:MAG TPA: M56 family metallopeptidase [Thermoanaerobaculia bacterium]|nr:M56 family metallopeptidase [Thermoanaerobaculia bacterium]